MNNSFFLTRQIANLMEDFVREIDKGSALFILYGEDGVGKSRLLEILKKDRLTHKNVWSIDFNTGSHTASDQINASCANAVESDVFIFDHFESAPNKVQQQVFDNWSTDGRDRQLNFIICCSSNAFGRCWQLAQQFHLQAMSYQLQSCTPEEAEHYLRHLLFPNRPFATLKLPGAVRRLVRQSNGLFSRLREIAGHHGGEIEIKHEHESRSRVMPFAIVAGLTLVISVAGYLYYFSQPSTIASGLEPAKLYEQNASQISAPVATEPKLESRNENEIEPEPEPESELNPVADAPLVAETRVEESSSQVTDSAGTNLDGVTEPEPDQLQQRLEYSLNWINKSPGSRGTIQIMSVRVGRFDNENYQAYTKKLAQQGLDISQLRVFETRAGDSKVYSLIYGDYTDTREANKQIDFLPENLQAAKPIPRSAGGISREIARISNG